MKTSTAKPATIDRPLGSTENIYWLLDQLYCLNFVVFAEVEGALDGARLKRALADVQDIHPLLRARIVEIERRHWFKPVARSVAQLLPEVQALRAWRRGIEDELHLPLATAQAPLARFLWFKGAGAKSVVAMTFHHTIGDGRSGVAVLLELLRRATADDSAPALRPAQPSSQSLDLILQKPPALGALQGLKFWLARGKDALQFAQQLPGYDPTPRAQRQIRILPLRVAPVLAATLQGRARENRASVHGALGAAQLLAINDQFGVPAPRRLALNSLADLRPALSGRLSEADLGLYVTTLCTVHAMEREPDFWALAREIRADLKQTIESGDGNLIHGVYPARPMLSPGQGVAKMVQAIVAMGPPSSMLTNIGRIDAVDLGPGLALRSVAFAVSPPAQHPICVTACTFGGQMFLNLVYDATKLSHRRAAEIGVSLVRHLTQACGLPGPGIARSR